ncbi:hypothetical protein ACJX0J_017184, partial [Zea mays]
MRQKNLVEKYLKQDLYFPTEQQKESPQALKSIENVHTSSPKNEEIENSRYRRLGLGASVFLSFFSQTEMFMFIQYDMPLYKFFTPHDDIFMKFKITQIYHNWTTKTATIDLNENLCLVRGTTSSKMRW